MEVNPKNVLFFEDDYESLKYLKDHLEKNLGWHVELSASPDVVKKLSNEVFDLVLVDIMIRPLAKDEKGEEYETLAFEDVHWMSTGLEFIRRLRRGVWSTPQGTPSDVPLVLLSAIADSAVESLEDEFLSTIKICEKPFRLKVFLNTLESLFPHG